MVRAVDGVSLAIWPGETLAVVGESGCGKTVTARSVLKLIDMPPGRFEAGQVLWQGRDLIPLASSEMDQVRAREIGMVFQEPMTSLNPVYTVGEQIAEAVRAHRQAVAAGRAGGGGRDARVGADPERRRPRARLPAPVFGRHAAAGDDRDGARLPPEAADRRRADHGARRDHPGADPGADGRHEGAARHGDHADHPRYGRGGRERAARRGDVCGQGGRGGAGARAVRQPAPSLHAGLDPLDPARRRRRRPPRAARADPGQRAEPVAAAAGLPLCRSLPVRDAERAGTAEPPLREVGPGHRMACIL